MTVDGKTTASISRDLTAFLGVRRVNVLCCNASHKVYRRLGRFFDDFDAALDGYKSGAMKTAIRTAAELFEQQETKARS